MHQAGPFRSKATLSIGALTNQSKLCNILRLPTEKQCPLCLGKTKKYCFAIIFRPIKYFYTTHDLNFTNSIDHCQSHFDKFNKHTHSYHNHKFQSITSAVNHAYRQSNIDVCHAYCQSHNRNSNHLDDNIECIGDINTEYLNLKHDKYATYQCNKCHTFTISWKQC